MTGSIRVAVVTMTVLVAVPGMASAAEIVHDAEYYVLEAQNAGRWVADNTLVVMMGDIVHVTKYSPGSGYTPMVFRGGKGDTTEVGAWGGAEFVRVIQRHMQRKTKYPDEGPARGVPYDGVENLRPESKAAVEAFLLKQSAPAR